MNAFVFSIACVFLSGTPAETNVATPVDTELYKLSSPDPTLRVKALGELVARAKAMQNKVEIAAAIRPLLPGAFAARNSDQAYVYCQALGVLGDLDSIPLLLQYINYRPDFGSGDWVYDETINIAGGGLITLGGAAVPKLLAAILSRKDAGLRDQVAAIIGGMYDSGEPLIELYPTSKDPATKKLIHELLVRGLNDRTLDKASILKLLDEKIAGDLRTRSEYTSLKEQIERDGVNH